MAAPFYDVSQTLTLVGGTEQHISANHIYDYVIVDNTGDAAGGGVTTGTEVYVATDGGTATVGGAHCEVVPYGQIRTFPNNLPNPNPHTAGGTATYYNGFTNSGVVGGSPNKGAGAFDQSASVNWTAQGGYNETGGWDATNSTYASVIAANAQVVTVTFQ
jgi:hypothetical protein